MPPKADLLSKIEALPGYIAEVSEDQKQQISSAPVVEIKDASATPEQIRSEIRTRNKDTKKLQHENTVVAACE